MKGHKLPRLSIMLLLPLLISCGSGTAAVQTGLTPTPFTQPTPVPTRALSLPTPTISTGEIAGTTPGKGDEVFVPPPTPTPYWDVSWPLNAIEQAQAITITMGDVPEISVPVSEDGRRQLLDAIVGKTEVDQSFYTNREYTPYPRYELLLAGNSRHSAVRWWGQNRFSLDWQAVDDVQGGAGGMYIQEHAALWKTVERMAPIPPHYGPETIRHLLHASRAVVSKRVEQHEITYEAEPVIMVARILAQGNPTDKPVPQGEPMMVVLFTVEGVEREVRVWMNDFTYGGRTYERELVFLTIKNSQP